MKLMDCRNQRAGTAERKGDREVSRRRHSGLHRNISLEGNVHNDGPSLPRHDGKGEEVWEEEEWEER